MTESKKEIRKRILALRDALTDEEQRRGSLLLTERILGHQWFYGCEDFLCFVSYGSEIDTKLLIEEAIRLGKRVYVPKVEYESVQTKEESGYTEDGGQNTSNMPQMEFYRIDALEELVLGYKGIPEPAGNTEKYEYSPARAKNTFMVMPGVAFDKYRNRIGYGKGFYDRYLSEREAMQLKTVAVGFRCQMTEEIPAQETDIRPGQIICV